MKKRILLTGAGPTGITGKLIKQRLSDDYILLTPSSKELDLTDYNQVRDFFDINKVDYIIHCAYFRGDPHAVIEPNLRMFYNLAAFSDQVDKMLYIGSGAEFDKSRDIIDISEREFGRCVPSDAYGFWKYMIAKQALSSTNIYDLRIFGTINPFEPYNKNVISNLCAKSIKCDCLELNQDCRFSFIDIDDVTDFIRYALENDLEYHDYNVTIGKGYLLSQIAEIVNMLSSQSKPIVFRRKGLNKEYTGSNIRLAAIYGNLTPIENSIKKVYEYMTSIAQDILIDKIDSRWNNVLISKNLIGGGEIYISSHASWAA